MTTLSIDFETCSTVDLRKSGVYPYARHPDTFVICMAYAFDNGPVKVWRFNQSFPFDVLDHVARGKPVCAWNAQFEHQIWNHTLLDQVLPPNARATYRLSLTQVFDTMAQGAYYGLPLGLDQAAEAAGTGHRKDKVGHALMMRMNKPRVKAKNGQPAVWWHLTDPGKLDDLCNYCAQDVEVERSVAALLPDLPDRERRIWLLDQRINGRGMGLDIPLIEKLELLAGKAKDAINARLEQITGGCVRTVGSTAALLGYLNNRFNNWPGDNLRKDTVAEALADTNLSAHVREVLQLRADGAKTSTAKLPAMRGAAAILDGFPCVRGMLQYYGAFRTGRWAGRLIQPQNMPRPKLYGDQIEHAIALVMRETEPEIFELIFGMSAMDVVSSLLRSVLVSRPGHKLAVADFSQIEARVLPWLAGAQRVLDVFRQGKDIYKEAAADIFNKPADAIEGDERQIGKVSVLALGFGGGIGAFQTMAAVYGVEVSDSRADSIKTAWRDSNPEIVKFWWALDAAFRAAILDPNAIQQVGFLRVGRWGDHVVIVLPSGRALFYRNARLQPNPDRPGQDDITYMGLNQYTRKWERLRTYGGKLAENVTQAVARDCMAEVMLAADDQDIDTRLTVHDELITEASEATADATLGSLQALMAAPPSWAPGLPVGSDGWVGHRYRK